MTPAHVLPASPLGHCAVAATAHLLPAGVASTGKLVVGVHVTTLEMTEGPPTKIQRAARQQQGKSPGGAGAKRQRRSKGGAAGRGRGMHASDDGETEEEEDDEDAYMAAAMREEVRGGMGRNAICCVAQLRLAREDAGAPRLLPAIVACPHYAHGHAHHSQAPACLTRPPPWTSQVDAPPAAYTSTEPSEYVRSRPRRQVGRRMQLGETTESTDLTPLEDFVGPPGTGAPSAQPFSVTLDTQAQLVMDFHSHLRCAGCRRQPLAAALLLSLLLIVVRCGVVLCIMPEQCGF